LALKEDAQFFTNSLTQDPECPKWHMGLLSKKFDVRRLAIGLEISDWLSSLSLIHSVAWPASLLSPAVVNSLTSGSVAILFFMGWRC